MARANAAGISIRMNGNFRADSEPARFCVQNQLKCGANPVRGPLLTFALMALIVQKYGGTSVGSLRAHPQRRQARRALPRDGHQVVVVVSAMAGETNRLLALTKELSANPDPRELDVIAATGEQVTIGLLAIALHEMGMKARSYTGGQVRILTDSAYTKARILEIDEQHIRADLARGYVVVVAGFQGVDEHGNMTTLGRGGSDTSGVALAAALKADECQIYTDVDGVYTTDPRIVPEARRLDTDHVRGNARAREPGLEGAADPLGRVRRQVSWCACACCRRFDDAEATRRAR